MVVLYAAFIGLLLASYITPIQNILAGKAEIPELEQELKETETEVAAQERRVKALRTPEGIERAARERYGMIMPGETVYIIPNEDDERD